MIYARGENGSRRFWSSSRALERIFYQKYVGLWEKSTFLIPLVCMSHHESCNKCLKDGALPVIFLTSDASFKLIYYHLFGNLKQFFLDFISLDLNIGHLFGSPELKSLVKYSFLICSILFLIKIQKFLT